MKIWENLLSKQTHIQVDRFLSTPGWEHGWQSDRRAGDPFGYWHKHFAGGSSILDQIHFG